MKYFTAFSLLVMSISMACAQQNGAPLPLPAPTPAGTPNTNAASAITKKQATDINAALVAARQATKEGRYGDSEALMLNVTAANPNLVLAWVELGLAQMGLEENEKAEKSFKIALGIDPVTVALEHNQDFYQSADAPGVVAPGATRASRNVVGSTAVSNAEKRGPAVLGTVYASLGEVFIREKKFPEGQAAIDTAVKENPADAAQYRRNEMILFFKAGNPDAQLAAADQAIALDPTRAMLYYFRGQALVSKAAIDPKTRQIVLPPGCAEAYQKYLELDPKGQYSADATSVLTAAGVPQKK
ncbi:MAG: tetratricopeptide repeat protein [Terracidiphilus sp.]|jgi:tetratricopeptide (TPR) repeat protein